MSGRIGMVPAAALLAVMVLCGCREAKKPVEEKAVSVLTVPATPGFLLQSASAIGSVKANDEVNLVARVEGFLEKRLFEEGQSVKKGQLLYQIEPDVYAARLKAAEAALEKAKANQQNAAIEYDRQKTLVGKDATSERAFDNATATRREADAEVKSAEAELALAQRNLDYTKISAPFDGMVGLSAVSEGNLVDKSTGTLATVVSVDPVRVEFVINELDLIELQRLRVDRHMPDLRVRLFLQDGSEYGEPGEISFWDNRISSTTGTLRMQALFPNSKRQLVAGMFVRIAVGPAEPIASLLLPQTAVMTDQAGEYVYAVGADKRVVRRDIVTGYRDGGNLVVESGLEPGELVIVEGVQKVRPGSLAAPVADEAALKRIPVTREAAFGAAPAKAPAAGTESRAVEALKPSAAPVPGKAEAASPGEVRK